MTERCCKQSNTYCYDNSKYSNDILVIQYNTVKYANIQTVVPYRDILIANCSNEQSKLRLSCSLPYTNTTFNDIGRAKIFPAILISGQNVLPKKTFKILDKTVNVLDEMLRPNYIVSLNQWLNIQKKGQFKQESGVFSYLTPKYKEYFTTYAHLLPFTQNFLLQYIPLGSVHASKDITATERAYSSNFIDFDWCTDTCLSYGGQFPGPGHNCYAFNATEYDNSPMSALNKLFGDATNPKANGMACNAQRTIVSQFAEYENSKIAHAGCFALNPFAVWVGLLPSGLERIIANHKVDNELPHEFGHTYNLPDHSGHDIFEEKTRSFGYKYKNGVSLPYLTTNKQFKREAMNSGTGDSTDYMFTTYSDYDLQRMINYLTKSKNHVKIGSQIKVDPNADHETTIVQIFRNMQDVQLYRINAYFPSVVANRPNAKCPVKLTSYTNSGCVYKTLTYETENRINKIIALPHDFYPKDGYIIVEKCNSQIFKKFFIRNDALRMPRAFKAFANSPNSQTSPEKIKHINTQAELTMIKNNPDTLINWLNEYDGVEIICRDGAWIGQIILHPATIKCINKPIKIKRDSTWSVDVFIYPDITENITKHTTVTYRYCNGWKQC